MGDRDTPLGPAHDPGGWLARLPAVAVRTAAGPIVAGVLTSVLFGLLGIALVIVGARSWTPGTVAGTVGGDGGWTSRSRAWFTSRGFYPPEVDETTGRGFSWTGPRAQLVLGNLDRSQAYRLSLRTTAGRPPGTSPPVLRVLVDGIVTATVQTSNALQDIDVDIPRRTAVASIVTLDLSSTFVPGPQDSRKLGIVVKGVSLTPASGHFRPSWHVLRQIGLAVVACVGGVCLCGFRRRLAVVVAAAVALGFAGLLLQDAAFIGPYGDRLVFIGIGVALTGAAVALTRSIWPMVGEVPEWPIAVGLVLCATALRFAVFAHPQAIVGDGVFHAHRAMSVHRGTYFFTSVTPKPFLEFPYPVALYVAAQPFWHYFSSELDLVLLLRGLTLGVDAMVGIALYAVARRQWNDRRTALLCAGLWPFANAPLQALSNANLTNAFGQALFGVAVGMLAWNAVGRRTSVTALVAASGVLAAAFLSHFGTVLVGIPILSAVGATLIVGARAHARRFGVWVLVVVVATSCLSYAVYYSHFNVVYRATFARLAFQQAHAPAASKVVASPAVKFQRWIDGTSDDYGLPGSPLLVAAGSGLFLLWKRRPREPLTLVLSCWVLVWASITLVEFFYPLELRANLAAAPVFVLLGAYALGLLAARSRAGMVLSIAATLLIGWDGVRVCLRCIGLNLN
jgi:hypothetical protein